jgi:hypothetical protein
MEIIDKYGYLEDVIGYVEKNIISSRNFQKLAKKSGINEVLLKKLSVGLQKFSEKYFFTCLEEELEKRHSSLSGADAEIFGADISIETQKGTAFISMILNFNIVIDGEAEDKIKIQIKIFSNKNIIIN